MTAALVERGAREMRRRYALEACLELELLGELLELFSDDGALRQPERQTLANGRVEREQSEPLAEPAVVARVERRRFTTRVRSIASLRWIHDCPPNEKPRSAGGLPGFFARKAALEPDCLRCDRTRLDSPPRRGGGRGSRDCANAHGRVG